MNATFTIKTTTETFTWTAPVRSADDATEVLSDSEKAIEAEGHIVLAANFTVR